MSDVTSAHDLIYAANDARVEAERELRVALADAARWKAEAERLREALDRAARALSDARPCTSTRSARAMLDKEAFMAASALSAGGGTDA